MPVLLSPLPHPLRRLELAIKYYLSLSALVLGLTGLVCAPVAAAPDENREVLPLTAADRNFLERQRNIIERIVTENFSVRQLQGQVSELYYVQKIIDKQLIPRQDTFDLQALGVVLGDIMERNLNLQWVIVNDRYGRSRALKHTTSDKLFFPVTMISRRVQHGFEGPVNVRALYRQVADNISSLPYSS